MTTDQIKRMAIIDLTIVQGRTLNQKALNEITENALEKKCSISNVDKDIRLMREVFNAPIKYVAVTSSTGYYTYTSHYDFSIAFLNYWSDFILFNKDIAKLL